MPCRGQPKRPRCRHLPTMEGFFLEIKRFPHCQRVAVESGFAAVPWRRWIGRAGTPISAGPSRPGVGAGEGQLST